MSLLGIKAGDSIVQGSTSVTTYVQLDTSADAPATGLTHASSGLLVYWFRIDGAVTQITPVSQTPTGVWTSGGFCEVNSTTAPGLYRLDLPNAALSGTGQLAVSVVATGIKPTTLVSWLVPQPKVFATVGSSPTRYLIRLSGPTLAAGQLLRRQLQVLTGAAAHERVTIVECDADGDVVVSPPFVVAPTAGDRVCVL
jgi:hypothetical protein